VDGEEDLIEIPHLLNIDGQGRGQDSRSAAMTGGRIFKKINNELVRHHSIGQYSCIVDTQRSTLA
jgi:hypothetical protein